MKDSEIVELIRSRREDKALRKLYGYYPKVERFIRSKGGSKGDAADIYQEALIIFCEKATAPEFRLTSSIYTYLFGVCRLLWRNELKKRGKRVEVSIETQLPETEESAIEKEMELQRNLRLVESLFNIIGERCKEVLQRFYYEMQRMKEIALSMGFSSENVAKNQKYKCLERLKKEFETVVVSGKSSI